jgi:hypothetical protein
MIDKLRKWVNDICTEPNDKTICPIRIVGIIGTLQGLVMQGYDVFIQHAHIDLQAFGIGLGATLAALGAALGFKKDSPKE